MKEPKKTNSRTLAQHISRQLQPGSMMQYQQLGAYIQGLGSDHERRPMDGLG